MEAQRQCPSQTPRRKSRRGLSPGTEVATALTRHLLFLCILSTFVASFDWDTLARLCSEPDSRFVERCNHYCLHSTVASASFLTCFMDLWKTLYYHNRMGPPSYMQSVVERNVVMWRKPVCKSVMAGMPMHSFSVFKSCRKTFYRIRRNQAIIKHQVSDTMSVFFCMLRITLYNERQYNHFIT